ncbi:MAG: hypothetical protein ABIX01_17040 [Chitinophagaceae bacterium]
MKVVTTCQVTAAAKNSEMITGFLPAKQPGNATAADGTGSYEKIQSGSSQIPLYF